MNTKRPHPTVIFCPSRPPSTVIFSPNVHSLAVARWTRTCNRLLRNVAEATNGDGWRLE